MQTAHLKLLSREASTRAGLNAEQQNLEVLCSDPAEGQARLKHDLEATIAPDFMGLRGTLKLLGRPESRLLPVRDAIGLKLFAEFAELASSVDDGADWAEWRRVRRVYVGNQPDTKAPIYEPQTETVRLKLVRSAGDETSDTASTSAVVIARAGTLKVGDVLTRDDTFVVVSTPLQEGEYERADLSLRTY